MLVKSEVNWAREHDWFVGYALDNKGHIVSVTVHDGTGWIDFTNFNELKTWAGY